uniref:Uncharacterized protein n=1 Tax=Serinus canaria TaxID=9135 RepID=A0A8C9ML27_SERCA
MCCSTPCCSVPSVFSTRGCWPWCETISERRRTPREKARRQKHHQAWRSSAAWAPTPTSRPGTARRGSAAAQPRDAQGTARSRGGRATSRGARRSTSTTVSRAGAASSWPSRRPLVCKSPAEGTRPRGVGCCARPPRESGVRGARAARQLLGPPRASPVPRGRCERGYTGARCERVDLFYLRGDHGQIVIISLIVLIVALIILVVGICLCSQYVGDGAGRGGMGRGSSSCPAPLAPGRWSWGCPRLVGHGPAGVGRCLGHSFGAGKQV